MLKIIFHIDDNNLWNKLFSNLKNIIRELNNNNNKFDIIVLANANAVLGYLDLDVVSKWSEFNNVRFKACNNSLNANKINNSLLSKEVLVVNSGVYELAIKQFENYSYIKL